MQSNYFKSPKNHNMRKTLFAHSSVVAVGLLMLASSSSIAQSLEERNVIKASMNTKQMEANDRALQAQFLVTIQSPQK